MIASDSYIIHSDMRENIFACRFSVHNAISLLRHEQVCLMSLKELTVM